MIQVLIYIPDNRNFAENDIFLAMLEELRTILLKDDAYQEVSEIVYKRASKDGRFVMSYSITFYGQIHTDVMFQYERMRAFVKQNPSYDCMMYV